MTACTNNKMIHCLGVAAVHSINQHVSNVLKQYDEDFLWLHEILAECKRTFAKPDVQLLPKTPSAKRAKRRVKRAQDSIEEVEKPARKNSSKRSTDNEIPMEDDAKTPPKRAYRTRAASRTTTASTKCSTNARNTRANKAKPTVPSPVCSIQAKFCKESPVITKDDTPKLLKENNNTPVNKDVSNLGQSPICGASPTIPGSPTPKNRVLSPYNRNNGQGHVKNKVNAFEELIESNSPTPKSGKTVAKENDHVPETPEEVANSPRTPLTAIKKGVLSPRSPGKNCTVMDSPLQCLNKSASKDTPRNSRRSSRRSVRKSLKMLSSETRLDTALRVMPVVLSQTSRMLSPTKIADKENSRPEPVSESTTAIKKSTRTRLRLKKEPKPDTSAVEDSSQNEGKKGKDDNMDTGVESYKNPVTIKSDTDNDTEPEKMETEEEKRKESVEKPVKSSTRTKLRKAQQPSSTSSDLNDSKKCESRASDTDNGEQTVKRSTRTKARKVQQQPSSVTSDSESETVSVDQSVDEDVKVTAKSTRTKTRKAQPPSCSSDSETENVKPVRASTRTKQRINTASSAASSVSAVSDSTESEEDSGIHCSKLSTESKPRVTRSKMRPPKSTQSVTSSVGSETSENDGENFAVPEAPPARSTRTKSRKRQHDDEDSEADTSMSKRSCTDERRSLNTTYETTGSHLDMLSDNESTMDTDSSVFRSPVCPVNKVVKPASFLNNLSNKIIVKPMAHGPTLVKSFIQRNTPPPKLTVKEQQEQRKKELQEKQRKEQQRLQKRDELLKMRIEEARKKREERMKKVAELREQKTKQELEQKNRLAKKMEEKRQITENLKEERLKEEKEKQKLRLKKQMEIEEKKKQEEEERQRKLKEQEEEAKQYFESMQKKKEQEELERQKRIADEMKKQLEHQERMAQLEKDRKAERERLKQLDEEKERERLKQKEEREKAQARERAERERCEMEKKKEREIQIKKGMEKIKELEKARLLEEQKRREELRERELAIKQMINHHNTLLANAVNSSKPDNLPKPNLNTTQTLGYSSSNHDNPDSYDMTPAKKKTQSSIENYDISDIKSDDSTDDDEAPRKRIPPWASGAILKSSLINQHYNPPNLDQLFDTIHPPDLNELFIKKKARFNKRTSSAHWDSPILKPGAMLHY